MTAAAPSALFSRYDILRLAPLFRVQTRDGRELPSHLDTLHHRMASEPERAPCEMPPDVITMNSLARLRDCSHGKLVEYRLVFPFDADASAGRISVLTPVGSAMLGARVGDVLEVPAPGAVRRLKVDAILYQPEADGRFDL